MLNQLRERKERRLGRVSLEEGKALTRLDSIFSELSLKYDMDYNNILQLLKKRETYISIPASIFNNSLSPLENVVLYLNVSINLNQTRIAETLNRDHTTIWTTLENAMKKIKRTKYKEFVDGLDKDKLLIPVSIFANRKLSILESISIYIKDKFNMSYHEIALLLGKNDRTVWTVVNRARKKLTILK